jgi:hypothetical protein
MRTTRTPTVLSLLLAASCYQLQVSAQAGYAQLSLDGEFGYSSGSSTAAVRQDIGSAFGLGSEQGTPYARAEIDMGTPVLAVSGFLFSDEGTGTLIANFGNNLTAGTTVDSKFDLSCAKISYAFQIPIGPVSVAPGVAVDYVDLSINMRDQIGIASEDVQLQAPLPMGFVRARLDLGVVEAIAEGGYVQVDVQDITAKLLDVEALVRVKPDDWLDLFVGYRKFQFQGDGLVDNDSFNIDIGLSGFLVGGGVRF